MYKNRITVDPEIMLGKPSIAGTRITVETVLKKLADGYSVDEVVEIYPTIKKQDVLAALAYSADVLGHEEMILG